MGQLSDKVLWMTKRKFTWDNLKVRAEVLRGGRGRGWVERGWGVGGWMWGGEERSTRVTYVSTSLLVFCVRPGVLTDTARGFSGWNVIVCLFYDVTSVSSPRRFCLGAVACAKNGCRIRPWQTYGNPPTPLSLLPPRSLCSLFTKTLTQDIFKVLSWLAERKIIVCEWVPGVAGER